jgi:mRNA-degrading endonuclease RelE of RelBE toxin-antitoxin system
MGNPDGNKERDGFADAINRAAFGNERVLLRRRGRAVAAVVPINDLRLLEALEIRIDLIEARAALAQANKHGAKPLDAILKELGFWLLRAISTIFLAPPAEQHLHALTKPLRHILVKRLNALRTHPRPPGVTKLEGLDHLYRIREGDYRIVYAIREKDLIVLAIKNGARAEFSRP